MKSHKSAMQQPFPIMDIMRQPQRHPTVATTDRDQLEEGVGHHQMMATALCPKGTPDPESDRHFGQPLRRPEIRKNILSPYPSPAREGLVWNPRYADFLARANGERFLELFEPKSLFRNARLSSPGFAKR